MRILEINHQEVGKVIKTDYWVMPLDMDEGAHWDLIAQAQKDYLDSLSISHPMPNGPTEHSSIYDFKDDNMTVGEAKRLAAHNDAAIAKAVSEFNFNDYLEDLGLIPLREYAGDDLAYVCLSWDRKIGQKIAY